MNPITSNTKVIYILRHGEPFGCSKQYLGQKNPPLNNTGRRQAEHWQRYFSTIKLDKIYCSDLRRAAETAYIISNELSTQIEYVPKMREIDLGKWDGMSFVTIRRNHPHAFYSRGANLAHYRPPCGESFTDLKTRALEALSKIIKETKRKALVVAHAGVNKVVLATILNIPLNDIFQIKQGYGAMNKILAGQGSLKIENINSRPEL